MKFIIFRAQGEQGFLGYHHPGHQRHQAQRLDEVRLQI